MSFDLNDLKNGHTKHFENSLKSMHFSDAGTGGGGPGGPLPPTQYLADQLTLFEPGMADYPHLLLLAPSMFFTFRHHSFNPNIDGNYEL